MSVSTHPPSVGCLCGIKSIESRLIGKGLSNGGRTIVRVPWYIFNYLWTQKNNDLKRSFFYYLFVVTVFFWFYLNHSLLNQTIHNNNYCQYGLTFCETMLLQTIEKTLVILLKCFPNHGPCYFCLTTTMIRAIICLLCICIKDFVPGS